MTETEWLECEDPYPIVEFLRQQVTERKLRLFAVACCRSIVDLATLDDLTSGEMQITLDLVERYADGAIIAAQMPPARQFSEGLHCVNALRAATLVTGFEDNLHDAWSSAAQAFGLAAYIQADNEEDGDNEFAQAEGEEHVAQVAIIRDIFGNPFRPVAFDTAWRTDTALSLARHMYESRDFSAMPILADALQDAGCDHDEILNHCRDANGVHVRGCWVVDLVLGKV